MQNVTKRAIAKSFFEATCITSLSYNPVFNNIQLLMKNRELHNRFSELTPILYPI
jgi:hypothetical protein